MQNNSRDRYASETSEVEGCFPEVIAGEEITAQPEPVEKHRVTDLLGVVIDCKRLNVREAPYPDARILTTIPVGSEVVVDLDASSNEFYKICNTAGIQGFCMKRFITLCD